jgi:hypothetical protein
VALSLAFGAVAVVAVGLAAPLGGAVATLSVVALAVGLVRSSRAWLSRAAVVGVGGVLVAGVRGGGPEALLVGLLGTVLAWDVADNAVGLGAQLGRETDTRRVEAVHTAGSLVVGAAGAAVGYGVFLVAAGGQPVAALVLLVVGVVALAAALRG